MDHSRKRLGLNFLVLLILLAVSGCRGLRRDMSAPTPTPIVERTGLASDAGWALLPLYLVPAAGGDLQVELAIRNDTGLWSAMNAADPAVKPAMLATKDGKSVACSTVQVSTGGHYLPSGFQIKGYSLKDGSVQRLVVVCKGVASAAAGRLTLPYSYVTGDYDYYAQEKTKKEAVFEIELDKTFPDLAFPVSSPSAVKAQAISDPIQALNKTTLTNSGVTRSADEIILLWKVTNPGEYDTKVHVGKPPVVGDDGILYGAWVSPDIVDQPFSPPSGEVEFSTQVAVPQTVNGFYLLLSVEQSRERLFTSYLIDLTALK